jgi:hypothetical protein
MMLLTIAIAGCAHSDKAGHVDTVRRAFTAEPPPFLNGPCALLLTNNDGYASQVVLERGPTSDKASSLSGELMVRGDKLFFAVESNGSKSKRAAAGTVSFVWDTTTNSGYVISDALQGYAPVGSNLRFTNLTFLNSPPSGPAGNRSDSRPGLSQEVTVAGNDGSLSTFRVWRSPTTPALPLRIESISGAPQFTLVFNKPQAVPPAPGMFIPPADFTKYDTAEAMMYEIVTRQQNARRRSYEPTPAELENQPAMRTSPYR